MNHKSIQLSPVTALQQLLLEHPELPIAGWSISPYGDLSGHLHDASMADLAAYAGVLGGTVRPGPDYTFDGQVVRPHRLTTLWRDVSVTVVVVLPAPAVLAVAA